MGTTITPPTDSFLLVKFQLARESALRGEMSGKPKPEEAGWKSCRRVIPMDQWVVVEGLNYDGRDQAAEKDVNQLLPSMGLAYFYWKYEPKPAPPPEATKKATPGKKGK